VRNGGVSAAFGALRWNLLGFYGCIGEFTAKKSGGL